MRYHYEKPEFYANHYGTVHMCDHPFYNRCTLFKMGNLGLAVIQQRFDPKSKRTYWTEIDPWLTDPIYIHPEFKTYFDRLAKIGKDDLYPTRTVRQVMWALKMKPIPKAPWETVFDRSEI